MIYCETNYDTNVRVEVIKFAGHLVMNCIDTDANKIFGRMRFCASAERECVERAKRIVAGTPLPGEMTPGVVL